MRPRIDPRGLAASVSAAGRLRSCRVPPASGRVNPHLEVRARVRRELRAERSINVAPKPSRKPLHRPAEDAPLVLVIAVGADLWPNAEAELLGTAREIWPGHAIGLATAGAPTCDPGEAGADRLLRLAPAAEEDGLLAVILSAAAAVSAAHLVFADMGVSGDLARRAVARSRRDGMFNVAAVRAGEVTRLLDGGRSEISGSPPFLVCLPRAVCAPLESDLRFEARGLEVPSSEKPEPAFSDGGLMPVDTRTVSLAEAEFVLSAGAGVTDWDSFLAVADALSATVAGSRVVCDAGHLTRDRQVGASGTLIEADCYVALGISGAPQHLQGIQGCRRVVAVNTDPHAPMLARADLAIVGDAQAVLVALRQELRREFWP